MLSRMYSSLCSSIPLFSPAGAQSHYPSLSDVLQNVQFCVAPPLLCLFSLLLDIHSYSGITNSSPNPRQLPLDHQSLCIFLHFNVLITNSYCEKFQVIIFTSFWRYQALKRLPRLTELSHRRGNVEQHFFFRAENLPSNKTKTNGHWRTWNGVDRGEQRKVILLSVPAALAQSGEV